MENSIGNGNTPTAELESQVEQLKAQLIESNKVAVERDKQINELIDEQDEYCMAFAEQHLRGQGTMTGAIGSHKHAPKSEKVPDPPLLSDGKDPKFEDWLVEM